MWAAVKKETPREALQSCHGCSRGNVLLGGRGEALDFVEPILDEIQPGHLNRFVIGCDRDQESSPVRGDIIIPDETGNSTLDLDRRSRI